MSKLIMSKLIMSKLILSKLMEFDLISSSGIYKNIKKVKMYFVDFVRNR